MAEVSASTLAVEGFRLLGREKGAVAAWAVIYLAAMVLAVGILLGFMGSALGVLLPGRAAEPALGGPMMKSLVLIYAVLLPLGLIAQSVMVCAVYRAILRPDDRGFYFLRVGADELRMILVSILLLLIGFLVPVAVAAAVGGVTASMPGTGLKVLTGLGSGIAGFCLVVWIGVRLCLASSMTFAERRVRVFGSWALTRGRFWPLLGAFVLACVLAILVNIVMQIVMAILIGLSGGALAGALHPSAKLDPSVMISLAPAAAGYLAVAALSSLLQMLIFLAPIAAAYRAIAVNPVDMADTFA